MKEIKVEKTVLKNGLRVVTSYRDSDVFSLGIAIKAGSLYENEENNGVSHFIEHMLFKGTSKRDINKLNDDIEELAGNLDVYTTYDHTALTIDIMKNRSEECMDILSDMIMNSSFPEQEFKLEKKVIIEEIKMSEDDPEDQSYLGLYKAAFPDKWYKYHITGTIKSVKGIKIEDLKEFYGSYYVPNNTIICIVSSYSQKEIVDMISRYFSEWKPADVIELEEEKYCIVPSKITRHKTGISQAHLLYGFDIQDLTKEEEVALALINEKIGAGANSALFKELRDKKGYAYSIYSDIDFTKNLKIFYIYAGISVENLEDAIETINSIISKYKEDNLELNEKGMKIIKEMFYTHTAIALESSSHMVEYFLDGEMDYGNPLDFQEMLSIMEEITINDIEGVVKKVFNNPIIHVIAPK